jgi:deoxyribose-phosphate aldolase
MTMTRSELARLIDHTHLDPRAGPGEIDRLCDEALALGVCGVCVNSMWIPRVAPRLAGSAAVPVATVGFPLGACATPVKAAEAGWAAAQGARELDMVMMVGAFLAGETALVADDIRQVRRAVGGGRVLKVILETGWLSPEQIDGAARLAVAAGADFVKTGTGYGSPPATPEAVRIMRAAVGPGIGVKAAGGIRTTDGALAMLRAGASRLGMSRSSQVLAGLPEPDAPGAAGGRFDGVRRPG